MSDSATKAGDTPLYQSAFEGLKYAYSLGKSTPLELNAS